MVQVTDNIGFKQAIFKHICLSENIDLIDSGRNKGCLILTVGAGLMLATMDLFEDWGWAIDMGRRSKKEWWVILNWSRFLCPSYLIINAWFSISNPDNLLDCLRTLKYPYPIYLRIMGEKIPEIEGYKNYRTLEELRNSIENKNI